MTTALEGVSGQQHAPAVLYPGKNPVPIVHEDGWAQGPVWKDGKSRSTGIRSPDRPARSSVTLPTELRGPPTWRWCVYLTELLHFCLSLQSWARNECFGRSALCPAAADDVDRGSPKVMPLTIYWRSRRSCGGYSSNSSPKFRDNL